MCNYYTLKLFDMNELKYIGLIECSASSMPYGLNNGSLQKGFALKKVLVKKNVTENVAQSYYPKAEIVRDLDAIISDQTIELVIISGSRNGCLNQVEQALKAGKQVRLM